MNEIVFWVLLVLIGVLSSYIVNYFSDVMPYKRKPVKPFCLKCGDDFVGLDYFMITKPCRNCGAQRSYRTWLVIIAFVISTLYLYYFTPQRLGFWIGLLLLIYFGIITVIDIEHRVILHQMSLFGAIFGGILGVYLHGIVPTVLGGVAGFLIMFVIYQIGPMMMRLLAWFRHQSFEGEPLGFGDVYLSGVVGLILGWPAIVAGLIITILSAGIFSLGFVLYKLIMRNYGPFIVFGAVMLLYFRFLFV